MPCQSLFLITCTGYPFRQDVLYAIDNIAFLDTHRESWSLFAFPAGTFDEVSDFKIEAAFEPPQMSCECFHVRPEPSISFRVCSSSAMSLYFYHIADRISSSLTATGFAHGTDKGPFTGGIDNRLADAYSCSLAGKGNESGMLCIRCHDRSDATALRSWQTQKTIRKRMNNENRTRI